MKITAVEPRRKQMCALFIDGEYVMNLDAQTLIKNRFDVGREIDDDELKGIIDKSNGGYNRQKQRAPRKGKGALANLLPQPLQKRAV